VIALLAEQKASKIGFIAGQEITMRSTAKMSEEKKLTDEELNELIKKLEYQSWAQNFFELSQAAHMLKRQKAEIETLKSELRKECEEHEEFTKKANVEIIEWNKLFIEQKAETKRLAKENGYLKECADNFLADYQKAQKEIERLTERLDYFQKSSDYHEGNQKELEAKNAELQKQVEYLKQANDNALDIISQGEKQILQVGKDTAKEIYFKVKHESGVELSFLNDLALWVKDRFGVAVEKWIKVDSAEVE
jgi:chromosome segregation ATPase